MSCCRPSNLKERVKLARNCLVESSGVTLTGRLRDRTGAEDGLLGLPAQTYHI
jgi:hypothetical protein